MGHGGYSYAAHQAITSARANLDAQQVFTQTGVHPLMNPHGVKFRECRDSAEHPEALAICFALDISGSMGDIPDLLARRELPKFMKTLMSCAVSHPQLLFMAFADARCDGTPLQVGQFESTAELIDKWLTLTSLAGQPGSSYSGPLEGGESYELALYFAARHTSVDAFEKRGRKGYLFMTGDEPAYPAVPAETVRITLGEEIQADLPIGDVMTELRQKWNPFFLIPDAARRSVEPYWRGVFGDDVICLEDPADTCAASAAIIALAEDLVHGLDDVAYVLQDGGISAERVGATMKAITPWWERRSGAAPSKPAKQGKKKR